MAADQGDYVITRPNRDKAASKTSKLIVAVLLAVSTALLVIVGLGGWSKMIGAQPLLIAYVLIYALMIFLVMRWYRGVLPMAAGMAILMGIFAAIAGPSWFDRSGPGFGADQLPWGNHGIPPNLLGLLTLVIVPVQVLLLGFSMQAFNQNWHVEIEKLREDVGERETIYEKE